MNENNFLKRLLERLYNWMPFYHGAGNNSIIQSNTGCESKNENEISLGQYNKSTESNNTNEATIFSIGIGTGDDDRKNAFEIKKSGDIIYSNGEESKNLQEVLNDLSDMEPISSEEIENLKKQ